MKVRNGILLQSAMQVCAIVDPGERTHFCIICLVSFVRYVEDYPAEIDPGERPNLCTICFVPFVRYVKGYYAETLCLLDNNSYLRQRE